MAAAFTAYDDDILAGLVDDYLEHPRQVELVGVMGDRLEDLQQHRLLHSVRALSRMHAGLSGVEVPSELPVATGKRRTATLPLLRHTRWVSGSVRKVPTLQLLYMALCARWLPMYRHDGAFGGHGLLLPAASDCHMEAERFGSILLAPDLSRLAFYELVCAGLLGTFADCREDWARHAAPWSHAAAKPAARHCRVSMIGHALVDNMTRNMGSFPTRLIRAACLMLGYRSSYNKTGDMLAWWLNEACAGVLLPAGDCARYLDSAGSRA